MTAGTGTVAVLALALAAWPSERGLVARRARLLRPPARARPAAGGVEHGAVPWWFPSRRPAVVAPAARRWLLATGAGAAAGLVVGGLPGLVTAGLVASAVERFLRRRRDRRGHERDQIERDLPVACDLLAACLSAGVPAASALAGVAPAVGGPLGDSLGTVAGLLRLGAEPRKAWADAPAEAAALARLLVRSAESGAAVSGPLRTLAADARAAARGRAEAAVRRAGVWVLAPLGLCFLPAFLCLGVIPLVLGIVTDVFG